MRIKRRKLPSYTNIISDQYLEMIGLNIRISRRRRRCETNIKSLRLIREHRKRLLFIRERRNELDQAAHETAEYLEQ